MTATEAIVYGLIQGLSEFLPVSSSGHLALLPHVMKIQDPGVVFDLMMHLGTALAVFTYFRREIFSYSRTFTPSLVSLERGTAQQWFVRNFLVSTFASVLLIVLLMPFAKHARTPWLIVSNLAVFGGLLWWSDWYNRSRRIHLENPFEAKLQLRLAVLIGAAQALAIFPGVSRSGITLTAALILGMRRKDAGAYSFLLSLPIIFAGILKEVPELMKTQDDSSVMVLLVGVVTSFLIGWATIHYFMKLIGEIELKYFAIYRWFIAAIMIWTVA